MAVNVFYRLFLDKSNAPLKLLDHFLNQQGVLVKAACTLAPHEAAACTELSSKLLRNGIYGDKSAS